MQGKQTTKRDVREISSEAMQELLSEARNIRKAGSGELSPDLCAKATKYYTAWKKALYASKFYLFVALFVFFAVSTYEIGVLMKVIRNVSVGGFSKDDIGDMSWYVGLGLMAYVYYRSIVAAKKEYVHEMLGTVSFLDDEDRHYYVKGLVQELWKPAKRYRKDDYTLEFRWLRFVIFGVVAVAPFLAHEYLSYSNPKIELALRIVFLVAVFTFALQQYVDEPKMATD